MTTRNGSDSSTATRVLAAGFPLRLRARLQGRLKQIEVGFAQTAEELLQLASDPGGWSLLIVDGGLEGVLARLPAIRAAHRAEILYCCPPGPPPPGLLPYLVRQLKVSRVLVSPLDPEELVRQVAMLLGVPVPAVRLDGASPSLRPELAGIWQKFEMTNQSRVDRIRLAIDSLVSGELLGESRRDAEREAHQLAGSLGTFGLASASLGAREIESLLRGKQPVGADQAARLCELVQRLQAEVAAGPDRMVVPAGTGDGPVWILLSDDAELLTDMVALPGKVPVKVASDPADVRQLMASHPVAALVVDLPEAREASIALIGDVSSRVPEIPLVVLMPGESLADRVLAAEHGGQLVLPKPISAQALLEVLQERLAAVGRQDSETRLLCVDDDPLVLDSLKVLLAPLGLAVHPLDDPLQFWDRLEGVAPDLVVLDVDMPGISGIELCRALRTDPRWADTPVLFLSAYNDSATVQRIFEAGADDYVSKPFSGPELTARIRNRLERARSHRSLTDLDPLTGVLTRRRGAESIRHHLSLARRRDTVLSLAVLDLDRFKRVNDSYGHGMGDEVLRRAARLIRDSVRNEDIVVRWGGEEFVIALYTMSQQAARARLDQIRSRLLEESFCPSAGEPFHVSFSAGIAEFPADGWELPALLEVADQALYEAKRNGRNQVLLASDANPSAASTLADLVLVEDDPVLTEVITEAAQSRGFRIECFRDSESGATALLGHPPRLRARALVLDHDLPGQSGLALLERLHQGGVLPRLKVILLTGKLTEDEILRGLDLGAVDHVSKPFHLAILMRKLERAIERL